MNWQSWLFWGAMATLGETTLEAIGQGLRLTRMSLPVMLGTMATSERSKTKIYGFALHILNGLLIAMVYIVAFHFLGGPSWWLGALMGSAHAIFVLTVGMVMMPEIHPRMASERSGPTAMRQLEPPGFLALNYGAKTPISILISHVVFGSILGSFCRA